MNEQKESLVEAILRMGSGWILQKGGGFYEVYTEEF